MFPASDPEEEEELAYCNTVAYYLASSEDVDADSAVVLYAACAIVLYSAFLYAVSQSQAPRAAWNHCSSHLTNGALSP